MYAYLRGVYKGRSADGAVVLEVSGVGSEIVAALQAELAKIRK